MKMNADDQRQIERLKADDRRWPFVRWFYVLIGGGLIAGGIRLFLQAIRAVGDDPALGLSVATLLLPVIPLAWCLGAILLREALQKWGGDPVRKLLLRLIEDSEEKETAKSQPTTTPYSESAARPPQR